MRHDQGDGLGSSSCNSIGVGCCQCCAAHFWIGGSDELAAMVPITSKAQDSKYVTSLAMLSLCKREAAANLPGQMEGRKKESKSNGIPNHLKCIVSGCVQLASFLPDFQLLGPACYIMISSYIICLGEQERSSCATGGSLLGQNSSLEKHIRDSQRHGGTTKPRDPGPRRKGFNSSLSIRVRLRKHTDAKKMTPMTSDCDAALLPGPRSRGRCFTASLRGMNM